eukprot:evm.model.NODE_8197_length_13378_cov_29.264015.1
MRLPYPFLASVSPLRALVLLPLLLAMMSSSSLAACPGSPFTFHFRVRVNKGLSRNAADKAVANVEAFFSTAQLTPALFVTRTTTLQDLCDSSIETLSVSTKSANDAVMRAMGNGDRTKSSSPKGGGKSKPLFVVVAVSGTPGLRAIDTRQVSNSLRTLLAENGIRATVTASVQKGPATISNLRVGANAARPMGINIPARTHTFQEYVASPTFKAYAPVVVADADFTGDISQDIVALSNGVALKQPRCSVTNVYRSPRFPKRTSSASQVLDGATFDELHPEEKDWVTQRLLKTGPKLASFIEQNLFALDPSARTDLKVAIAVSGGGKRSLFNAAGVTSSLAQAGVLDLATWMAGSSGGSWLLGGFCCDYNSKYSVSE